MLILLLHDSHVDKPLRLFSLKRHHELFRWFDLYLRKDTAEAEIELEN
jgi:hypothetical protein